MHDESDEQLVARYREGEQSAFRELFERHWPGVYAVCARFARDEAVAEDLTQETFILAMERLASFRGEAQLSTWLHRIAVNASLAWLRRRARRDEIPLAEVPELAAGPVGAGDAADEVAALELREALWRAVEELPPRQRAVFVLRTAEEKPFAEIAEILGKSVGGTKANYHLAVQNLRRKLAPLLGDAPAAGRKAKVNP